MIAVFFAGLFTIFYYIYCRFAYNALFFIAALLLKLGKRIADVPIVSKELEYTKPGPYIYDFLSNLNITYKTSSKLRRTIEDARLLLEEDSQ